jgi:hypothetical protein
LKSNRFTARHTAAARWFPADRTMGEAVAAATANAPPPARRYLRVSARNLQRFPGLARLERPASAMASADAGDDGAAAAAARPRWRPSSGRLGKPPAPTPNLRDLYNARLLPQTSREIRPPCSGTVGGEGAGAAFAHSLTQRTRVRPASAPFRPAGAPHRGGTNGGGRPTPPAGRPPSPREALRARPGSAAPRLGGGGGGSAAASARPVAEDGAPPPAQRRRPCFRPSSASTARDGIRSRVTLWSQDEAALARERARTRLAAKRNTAAFLGGLRRRRGLATERQRRRWRQGRPGSAPASAASVAD